MRLGLVWFNSFHSSAPIHTANAGTELLLRSYCCAIKQCERRRKQLTGRSKKVCMERSYNGRARGYSCNSATNASVEDRKVGDMSAQDPLAPGPSVHPWVSDGAQRIRFGISASLQSWPEMHDLAQMAEGLGFDSFWRIDHPMLGQDCWTTLPAVAAVTRTIRLGTHVSCVAYRPPVLLARRAAPIDPISNGPMVLGLASADIPPHSPQFRIPTPPLPPPQPPLQ